MDSVVGLITEYNPFHKGHLYHLEQSKKITHSNFSVVIMSGNFVQRGEPAIVDKWERARMALLNGVDLVIELPVAYSIRSAEYFASGALKLLDSCGIVSHLCFGSEIGDLKKLKSISDILLNESSQYKNMLKDSLGLGVGYAKARELALQNYVSLNCPALYKDLDILHSPNNILGIEYLKALSKLKSSIIPHTFSRIGSSYHEKELSHSIASATAIRNILFKEKNNIELIKPLVPMPTFKVLKEFIALERNFSSMKNFEQILLYLLRLENERTLTRFSEISEGLEYRISEAVKKYNDLDSIIEAIKTKRYTYTRIKRILSFILLRIEKKSFIDFEASGGPQYIRVLGFTSKGRFLLSKMKSKASLPIVTNVGTFLKKSSPIASQMMALDIQASNIYFLSQFSLSNNKTNMDFHTPVIHIDL